MTKMVSPTLLILAAGMGSRYGGLKQMDTIGPGSETFIDYSVYDALRAGFAKIVFVIRKDIEHAFRQRVGARFENRIAVEYAFQELDQLPHGFSAPVGRTKPWGTTHAVLSAADVVHEPFCAINADDFYGAESYRLLAQHLTSSPDCAMAGFILRNTLSEFGAVARGLCSVTDDGFLESVVELTSIRRSNGDIINDAEGKVMPLTGDELVSMNMWGIQPSLFDPLREHFRRFLERHGSDGKSESYLPGAIDELVEHGCTQVKVLPTNARWLGVTYREDRARVTEGINQLIGAGLYPERLWA